MVLKVVGVEIVLGDYEGKKCKEWCIVVILVLMNKVVFVLCMCGVFVMMIYCILYMLVYDLDYECIVDWLIGVGECLVVEGVIEGLIDVVLDWVKVFYD